MSVKYSPSFNVTFEQAYEGISQFGTPELQMFDEVQGVWFSVLWGTLDEQKKFVEQRPWYQFRFRVID